MKTQLIDGWKHPLSETSEFEGETVVNPWFFASTLCAVAIGRLADGDREVALGALEDLGIYEIKGYQLAEILALGDAEYLLLINRCHSALIEKLEREFGD